MPAKLRVLVTGGSSRDVDLGGGWYQTLAKPTWTPPDGLFGPVWTALYLMMAVSAWLVWRQGGSRHGVH